MSNKPTHTAYIVTEPKEGTDRKAQWHEIGAIWLSIGAQKGPPIGVQKGPRRSGLCR